MIDQFSPKVQAAESRMTLRALLFCIFLAFNTNSFVHGNKRDYKARRTFDESVHTYKDISDMLGLECSLSLQVETERSNSPLRVIENFHQLIKDPGS